MSGAARLQDSALRTPRGPSDCGVSVTALARTGCTSATVAGSLGGFRPLQKGGDSAARTHRQLQTPRLFQLPRDYGCDQTALSRTDAGA